MNMFFVIPDESRIIAPPGQVSVDKWRTLVGYRDVSAAYYRDGVGGASETVAGRDAGIEPKVTYSRRVS